MNRFLTLKYYFAALPDISFQYSKATLALGILLLVASVAFAYIRKKKIKDKITRKVLKPYPAKLSTYGFVILFLLGVREVGIPYLSMRIWWFLALGLFLHTGIKLAMGYKSEYKKRSSRATQNKSVSKYLPKKKK